MFFSDQNSEIHFELPQLKSQDAALKIKSSAITQISKDAISIKGSGKDEYIVTISKCSCPDFLNNKKSKAPCKHIYRFAMDNGIFSIPATNHIRSSVAASCFQGEIERWKQEYISGAITIERFIKICEAFK